MDSEMIDVSVKSEPEQLDDTDSRLEYDEDDSNLDDPVVSEIDVYLSRSLANNIYILQVGL